MHKHHSTLIYNRYRVASYSISLSPPQSWTYTFTLVRESSQPPFSSIQHIPNAEQMDDWEDYQALSKGVKTPLIEVTKRPTGIGGLRLQSEIEKAERDSGYFSVSPI